MCFLAAHGMTAHARNDKAVRHDVSVKFRSRLLLLRLFCHAER